MYLNDAGVTGLNRSHEGRVIADMRNFLVSKDRLDQKLTFVCSDGRSIEGDLNLWLLTRLAGVDYVCYLDHTHFVFHSVISFFLSRSSRAVIYGKAFSM